MAIASLAHIVRSLDSVALTESDAALLTRFARNADETAFAEIVRRHGPAVLGVCRRVLREEHAADDAFQVTFLLLARKGMSLRCPDQLSCWLHGVAYRTALKLRTSLIRHRMREQPVDETTLAISQEPDPELGAEIDAAIQQLPAKYRVPVVLCYLQGLTNAQAAATIGCPANTVATRLARARLRLRNLLVKQGLTVAVSATLAAATARSAVQLASGMKGLSQEIVTLMEGVRTAMMWKKIKLSIAAIAFVALTGLGASHLSYQAAANPPAGDEYPNPAPAVQPPVVASSSNQATTTQGKQGEDRIPAIDVERPTVDAKNFVVTGVSGELKRRIVDAAERHRREIARLWLGKELPNWPKPCTIQVRISDNESGSATIFKFAPAFEVSAMQVSGSVQDIVENLLPHEVTHTVIADHFRWPIPRWVDEGIAISSERVDEQMNQLVKCKEILREGRAMRLKVFFGRMEYPGDAMVTYAEGYSVVKYLIELKGRPKLLEFVKEGMKDGWDKATKGVYGFNSVDALESAWIEWLRKKSQEQQIPVDSRTQPPVRSQIIDIPHPTIPRPPVMGPLVPQPADAAVPPRLVDDSLRNPSILVVSASMTNGLITCKFPKKRSEEQITTYQQDGDRVEPVTSSKTKITEEVRNYQIKALVVLGADGKPLSEKEVTQRLAKETPVLFIHDHEMDPRIFAMLKPDALIISERLPGAPPAGAPPTPLPGR